LFGGGSINVARSGDECAIFNRLTSDGEIVRIQKDGSTVGSINTEGGDLAIGNADAGIQFINGGQVVRPFNVTTNARIDAQVDLGMSTTRFKDLYLSGEVIVGAGANNNPSITSHVDTDTGLFFGGGNILGFSTGGAERMRLDAAGAFLVGKTSNDVDSGDGLRLDADGAMYASLGSGNASYYVRSGNAWNFYVLATGQIYSKFTSIASLSDKRLKENVRDCEGLEKILQLQPRKFDWKAGHGKDIADDRGFIAQEIEQVFPELVGEYKESLDDDAITYKTVSQDLIPVLVKAIQELKEELNTATARITELENN
jgi:hypothetical protein